MLASSWVLSSCASTYEIRSCLVLKPLLIGILCGSNFTISKTAKYKRDPTDLCATPGQVWSVLASGSNVKVCSIFFFGRGLGKILPRHRWPGQQEGLSTVAFGEAQEEKEGSSSGFWSFKLAWQHFPVSLANSYSSFWGGLLPLALPGPSNSTKPRCGAFVSARCVENVRAVPGRYVARHHLGVP